MPRNFMQRRNQLKFFAGSNLIQDYLFSLQNTSADYVTPESLAAQGLSQAVRTEGPAGFSTGFAFGVPIQEVPLFDEDRAPSTGPGTGGNGDVWLTYPQNLLWGVKREIILHREFKPKKDTVEFTMYCRVGVQIEEPNAFVLVRDVEGTV
jgi:hypothetical protein